MRFLASARKFLGRAFDSARLFAKNLYNNAADIRQSQVSQMPNLFQQNLDKYGGGMLTNMKICRKPIPSAIDGLLNSLSFGKFAELKKKYGYDTFYHLYMKFDVNGIPFKLEKNQTVNLQPIYYADDKDCVEVPYVNSNISLLQLVQSTQERMGGNFFVYDAFNLNCQNFIMNVLQSNNLDSPELTKFVLQPIDQLVKELPGYVPQFAKALTDVAGFIDTGLQKQFV
jgi:hypothetical protein